MCRKSSFGSGFAPDMSKLDAFDIQLLNLLQRDSLATAEELARDVTTPQGVPS